MKKNSSRRSNGIAFPSRPFPGARLEPQETDSFVILDAYQKLRDRRSQHGVDHLRRDLAQGDQNELAVGQLRMGNLEIFLLQTESVVQEDIQIDDARAPLFADLLPAHRPLDILAFFQQHLGLELGRELK